MQVHKSFKGPLNLYVTSDTHFNHNKEFIFKKRGYESPSVMNLDMINIINQTVGTDGILLHLGDFCLNTKIEEYYGFLNSLKIKSLWLLNGNHNNPHSNLDYREVDAPYEIVHLGDYYTFRYNKESFVCFHFPLAIWDGISHGSNCLVGHSHGDYDLSRPENKQSKILDCGWDVFGKPIHINEIIEIMKTKGTDFKHHDV